MAPLTAAVSLLVVAMAMLAGGAFSLDPSPEPVVPPSPAQSPASVTLFHPGDSADLTAMDTAGDWGIIQVERGEDLGGYEDAAIPPGTFIVEFWIDYDAHRLPLQPFGSSDWALRPTDAAVEQFVFEPTRFNRTVGPGFRPEAVLGEYPARTDARSVPTEGRIAFAVPNEAWDVELELVYLPAGMGEVATVTVRAPGPAPDPVAFRTPAPRPGSPVYVERDGLPITVIDSAAADELFSRTDVCTNPEAGYTVTYPDDWYTNTAIGSFPACSWFTPEYFEVLDESLPPDEIWIGIGRIVGGGFGYIGTTEVFFGDTVTIEGWEARRLEYNPRPMFEPAFRGYHYVIVMGTPWEGPTIVAGTSNEMADDYPLARAVLDRIMASLEFHP